MILLYDVDLFNPPKSQPILNLPYHVCLVYSVRDESGVKKAG